MSRLGAKMARMAGPSRGSGRAVSEPADVFTGGANGAETAGVPDQALGPELPPRRLPRLASHLGLVETGRVLAHFATYLPSQAIPALAGFLVLPILARRLFPTELGVLAITQTLVS